MPSLDLSLHHTTEILGCGWGCIERVWRLPLKQRHSTSIEYCIASEYIKKQQPWFTESAQKDTENTAIDNLKKIIKASNNIAMTS